MSDDIAFLELTELTARMHAGTLSPVEATETMLTRIEALDPALHSYALVLPAAAARAQAKAAEAAIAAGHIRGPLHGAPIAVKDLCWMAGVPTAAGTTIHADFRPAEDATVVRRLRDAGAIILGKLQLTEGAYADHHPKITPPVNPFGAEYWSGASSSGSGVATAAGLCYGSLGSDTGGSIRFPCAAEGLTGLKPSWGRVSRYGVFELAATLDHIGPMTRSARDAAAMLSVIAGPDPHDPTALHCEPPDFSAHLDGGVAGLRVGIDRAWVARAADDATRAVLAEAEATLRGLGASITEIAFPDVRQSVADWFPLCGVEVAVAHEATYPSRQAEYGPALAGLIELGRGLSGMDYQRIILRREDLRGRGERAVRRDRPVAGSRPGPRRADARGDGDPGAGRGDDGQPADLHLSVRHDRASDHNLARRVDRGRNARRVPAGRGAPGRSAAVPRRPRLPARHATLSPPPLAAGLKERTQMCDTIVALPDATADGGDAAGQERRHRGQRGAADPAPAVPRLWTRHRAAGDAPGHPASGAHA